MGIAIPQVITSDRATGAQVIDGSLKFDGSKSKNRFNKNSLVVLVIEKLGLGVVG